MPEGKYNIDLTIAALPQILFLSIVSRYQNVDGDSNSMVIQTIVGVKVYQRLKSHEIPFNYHFRGFSYGFPRGYPPAFPQVPCCICSHPRFDSVMAGLKIDLREKLMLGEKGEIMGRSSGI